MLVVERDRCYLLIKIGFYPHDAGKLDEGLPDPFRVRSRHALQQKLLDLFFCKNGLCKAEKKGYCEEQDHKRLQFHLFPPGLLIRVE
jgi:hypothetical protein